MELTPELVYFFAENLAYLILNCAILVILFTSPKIPSHHFVVNLVIASLFGVMLFIVLGLDYYGIIDIKGPCLCGIQAFTKKVLTGVVPLTLVGISFERVRSLPRIYHVESFLPIWKVVCLTWGVSALLAIPRYFAYEYVENPNYDENDSESAYNSSVDLPNEVNHPAEIGDGNSSSSWSECRKTPILGKVWVKILYESVICCLLHFSPAFYNIYALHKIKFKLEFIRIRHSLKQTIGRKLYKKLKHIRLAFLYTTTFALIWIPYGIIMVWRAYTEDPNRKVVNVNAKSPKRNVQSGIERLFLTAHPVIYLYTHHHSRFTSFLKTCKSRFRNQHANINVNNHIMTVSTIQMETFEASG